MQRTIAAAFTTLIIPHAALGDDYTRLGESAPAIEVEHWVKSPGMDREGAFDAVSALDDGRIYVFDFWATWCAPCIASFPTLSEMQENHADDGLVIVGVSPEPLPLVVQFMQRKAGNQTQYDRMGFHVAVDADDSIRNSLLPPELREEIPMAAIVDRSGRLVYTGYTNEGFEGIVAQVVAGTWDVEAHAAEVDAFLAQKREKQRIMAQEDWPAALAQFPDDALFLTTTAFAIAFNYGGAIKSPDNGAATEMAQRAVELTDRGDAYALHTLAKCRFNAGDPAGAVRLQSEAVEVRNQTGQTPHYKGYYEDQLATYRNALEERGG